ncbi:MAG: carboxypeptidase regulatory-like domain-containing protein [Planctomycetes bacterium]|nr:carboxypeptidase regulatory-like domain-containing protein [Planctomycetota bacterium]
MSQSVPSPRRTVWIVIAVTVFLTAITSVLWNPNDDAAPILGDETIDQIARSGDESVEADAATSSAAQPDARSVVPASSENEPASRLRVLVVTETGAVIAGAHVSLWRMDRLLDHGESNVDGTWSTATFPPDDLGIWVYVSADGFADSETAILRWEWSAPATMRIVMLPEAVLRGVVTSAGGIAPPPETKVFAWSRLGEPDTSRLRALRSGAKSLLHTRVAADGSFELHGMDAKARYTVAAGAPGWACVEFLTDVTVERHVAFTLGRVFGGVVRAKLNGDLEAPCIPGANAGCDPPDGVISVICPSVALTLAGVDEVPGGAAGLWDWRAQAIHVFQPTHTPESIEVEMHYVVPGLERKVARLPLKPVSVGGTTYYDVRLAPTALGFGRLSVELEGHIEPLADAEQKVTPNSPILELLSKNGGAHLQVPLPGLGTRVHDVLGIPFGTYGARLILNSGAALQPIGGGLVTIEQTMTKCGFDLAGRGSLWLVPESFDVRQQSRGVSIILTNSASGRRLEPLHCSIEHCVIEGLRTGRYSATIRSLGGARSRDWVITAVDRIDIDEGKLSTVRFSW